ncbi:VOC family protein [Amycolatopsis vancoresmycina]|uniref:Glyoxalase/bleomycin resistance protein/dioxygenase n=1 Tax=Amycolatopsis vancoresmycina DSM 44592 TaxID=1292037 RepID=R1HXK0_9PSEU|nr:VOC family protein [Amycolatopsis vancoresmycina]EOD68285.1 glyoxalase/bleomycin resistance protein/dioxygenase [Amycolatopsis vancoresmycina DSM 44592]
MPEPFDALRRPSERVAPDPDFAAELRDDLRRLILNGADMTTTSEAPVAASLRSLTPYLVVADARAALDFYVGAFGAVRRADPIVMDDGRVGHAELAIGDSVLMLAEEYPELGHVVAPEGGPLVRIEVPDPRATAEQAVELGAELLRPVEDRGYGLAGTIRDPFGQKWLLAQAASPAAGPKPARHGEAMYFTFQVPDDERAKTFYGAVLGWQFTPGSVPDAWGFSGPALEGGLWGGDRQTGWKLMYAVDDLASALGRVREQGGRTGEVENHPYGNTADCTDNQGIEFWLWEKP